MLKRFWETEAIGSIVIVRLSIIRIHFCRNHKQFTPPGELKMLRIV